MSDLIHLYCERLRSWAASLSGRHPNSLAYLAGISYDVGSVEVWEVDSHQVRSGTANPARTARSSDADAYLMGIASSLAERALEVADDDTLPDVSDIVRELDRPADHISTDGLSTYEAVQAWTDLRLWRDEEADEYLTARISNAGSDISSADAIVSTLELVGYRLFVALLAELAETLDDVEVCDCSEDGGPCEAHGTTVVSREGASTRTADDLLLLFCEDAAALLEQETGESRLSPWAVDLLARADQLLAEHYDYGCRWFPESDEGATVDELETLRSQLESELSTLDAPYWVTWDDGYRIVRVANNCPLLEV